MPAVRRIEEEMMSKVRYDEHIEEKSELVYSSDYLETDRIIAEEATIRRVGAPPRVNMEHKKKKVAPLRNYGRRNKNRE